MVVRPSSSRSPPACCSASSGATSSPGPAPWLGAFAAFNLVNYAAGLTSVSWLTFAWTTALGILPATILMVLAGAHIEVMGWQAWLLVAGAILLLCLVLRAKLATRPPAGGNET